MRKLMMLAAAGIATAGALRALRDGRSSGGNDPTADARGDYSAPTGTAGPADQTMAAVPSSAVLEHVDRRGTAAEAAVDHDRAPGVPPPTTEDYEGRDAVSAQSFPASDPPSSW